MEKQLKQIISNYYRDAERQYEEVPFEDCFPGPDPAPLLWFGRAVAAGIAAVLVMAVVIAGGALRQGTEQGGMPLAGGDLASALVDSLQQEFTQTPVLELSEQQTRQFEQVLTRYFSTAGNAVADNVQAMKGELFRTVINDPGLALSAGQTRVVAGLMSSWAPYIEDGSMVEYDWIDDKQLSQFLAGCAEYCHQGTPAVEMQSYLTDCVMRGFAIPCSPLRKGLPVTRSDTVLPN